MLTITIIALMIGLSGAAGYTHYHTTTDHIYAETAEITEQQDADIKIKEELDHYIIQLSREAQRQEKARRLHEQLEENKMIAEKEAEEARKAKEAEEALALQTAEAEKALIEVEVYTEPAVVEETVAVVNEPIVEVTPVQEVVEEPVYVEPVVEEVVAPVSQARTDGFNFNGYHFGLQWFSGSGLVPADSYVYRWTIDPSHYLIEMMGVAGGVIRQLGVGSQVTIDGQNYTIFRVDSGIANDDYAYYNMKDVGAAITLQTCDIQKGANGKHNLTIWYANPS